MKDYYLLIAVIAVLLIGAVKGYNRGFLRLAVWFAGIIAVLFIVTKLSSHVSSFLIDNTSIYDNLRVRIIEAYEGGAIESVTDTATPGSESEDKAIDSFGFPELISDYLKTNNTSEIYEKLAISLFEEYIAGYLAALSIKSGTFVGLFILFIIVEFIVLMAVKALEKIPVLRTINRLAGMATGITLSLVFIWVFFLAAMMFFGRSFGGWIFAQVGSSRFLSYLFNNNILFELIE